MLTPGGSPRQRRGGPPRSHLVSTAAVVLSLAAPYLYIHTHRQTHLVHLTHACPTAGIGFDHLSICLSVVDSRHAARTGTALRHNGVRARAARPAGRAAREREGERVTPFQPPRLMQVLPGHPWQILEADRAAYMSQNPRKQKESSHDYYD